MSEIDRAILEKAGLSQRRVSKYLGVRRQAVGHGLDAKKDYLTYERVRTIYEGLLDEGATEEAKKFEEAIDSDRSELLAGLRYVGDKQKHRRIDAKDNPFEYFKKEAWIFANRPLELSQGDFLDWMKGNHLSDPERRFAYFMAPGHSVNELARILAHTAQSLKRQGQGPADIYVIESNAMALVPHTVIFDASVGGDNIEPRGYSLTTDDDQVFYELPHSEVVAMLSCIRSAGIGLVEDEFLPPGTSTNQTLEAANSIYFKILYQPNNETDT